MIQHGKSGICLKYRKDPDNTEQTDPDHCADGRIQGVAAVLQKACGNLIQAADGFKAAKGLSRH